MKTTLTLFSVLLFVLMLPVAAIAVAFTPTSNPTGVEAGLSNQLLNFSIQNIGSVNITQLNITLPNGFTFTGTSGTTATSPYTSSSTTPSWINGSSIGVVGAGTTQFFWVYVTPVSVTGSYSFNITTLDINGVFNSSNVTVAAFDTRAPAYSSNTTSPSSNLTWSANQTYWFNITWTDGSDVSKALLEHNITGSGTPHNDTMANSSSVYYLNVRDLASGIYVWRAYANDTNNTFNSTSQFTYVIRQAANDIWVHLNGTLNDNITSLNNTAINITVNSTCVQSGCNITVIRDGGVTLVSGGPNPYSKSDDVITSVGLHNYTVTVPANANYSSNSKTFFVATVPNNSTTVSNMPSTFSNTTVVMINITFDSNPSLVNAFIQGGWTGTDTNFTMSNTSLTSYYYNVTFPAGTYKWKIYGVYSNHTFGLTTPSSFTINAAAPALTLSITPQWTLDSPVTTNVSCTLTVASLAAKLYRNNTAVSNPDAQTFTAGNIYEYLCNNTVNQNYTTDTIKNTLILKQKPSANISFLQAPTLSEIVQNSTTTYEIKVKNAGSVNQDVAFDVEGIDKSWYSLDKTSTTISIGSTATFSVTFKIGEFDVKDYPGKFNAKGTNSTISQDFTLRVLPSNETKAKINDTIALYKLDASKLENRFAELKAKINNTETIEQKTTELNTAVKQAEDYANSNNYFQAQQTLETIKALIGEVENLLKAAETGGIKGEVPSTIWLIVIGVIIVIVVGILAFLFWPVRKGYEPETGYVYGGGEEKRGLLENLKNFISKFKRKKKTETVLSES